MQLEAIYEQGRLKFLSPVTFTQTRFQVRVDVPAEVIVQEPLLSVDVQDLDDYARDLVSRLDAIRNAPLPADEMLPRFSPKQYERLEAAALRADFRQEF